MWGRFVWSRRLNRVGRGSIRSGTLGHVSYHDGSGNVHSSSEKPFCSSYIWIYIWIQRKRWAWASTLALHTTNTPHRTPGITGRCRGPLSDGQLDVVVWNWYDCVKRCPFFWGEYGRLLFRRTRLDPVVLTFPGSRSVFPNAAIGSRSDSFNAFTYMSRHGQFLQRKSLIRLYSPAWSKMAGRLHRRSLL